MSHTFHIPVLGLAYSVDTPIKVARFGISSVVSVIQHELLEQLRAFHSEQYRLHFEPITKQMDDFRAHRVTAYLNMLQEIVTKQFETMRSQSFDEHTDLTKYFKMLPSQSSLKQLFMRMKVEHGELKEQLMQQLRSRMKPGSIDVNIMTKVDNPNFAADDKTPLPAEYSDALSALRGFAHSKLQSSVVFSAGLNPRLYSYVEQFSDFFPDAQGVLKKKIILKVSDYRSALIQGRFLAKKGIWISEFRIESGLNCGGHAFATDGYLLGPILHEFQQQRQALHTELFTMVNTALANKNLPQLPASTRARITVQGGIGTAEEDAFLRTYYGMDATGWGSPFLLVPEVTNVDEHTLEALATAVPDDYYLSHASPLGVPFNNFRKSSAQQQLQTRMVKNRPGSPCYKKHLAFNTEFTTAPICEASRQYQHLKLQQLAGLDLTPDEYRSRVAAVVEKDCLCEGLSAPALLKNSLPVSHRLEAVTICPGPNLAYFSGVISMQDMVDHIYGRTNVRNAVPRAHMFMNELHIYIKYLQDALSACKGQFTAKQQKYYTEFVKQLFAGIQYYVQLAVQLFPDKAVARERFEQQLADAETALHSLCEEHLNISADMDVSQFKS